MDAQVRDLYRLLDEPSDSEIRDGIDRLPRNDTEARLIGYAILNLSERERDRLKQVIDEHET